MVGLADLSYNQLVYIDAQSFSNLSKLVTCGISSQQPHTLKQPEYEERYGTVMEG